MSHRQVVMSSRHARRLRLMMVAIRLILGLLQEKKPWRSAPGDVLECRCCGWSGVLSMPETLAQARLLPGVQIAARERSPRRT